MQVSSRFTARHRKSVAGLIIIAVSATMTLYAEASDSDIRDSIRIARRAYFVGTTETVRDKVLNQSVGHTRQIGSDQEQAELRRPPPACGADVQRVFTDFCANRLKVALAPCDSSATLVLCSTDYLKPTAERTFWRLRYRHRDDEASLELEVLRRSRSGRVEPAIDRTNELEELFERLLIASRCK
jgi:hypothetical protein